MKVTYKWLKDFAEIKISAEELAEKLTMAGLEVTSLEKKDGDFIFEIEITSNRPDCLSVIGIAREVAAITNSKLSRKSGIPQNAGKTQNSKLKITRTKERSLLKIEIEDKKDCPLYTAKILKNIKLGPAPDWLKNRLELVGCRSINNIVDITNYILFTFGEPLHVFDLDKLSGNAIIVRRAKQGEQLITIDGEKRILSPEILVIADREKPVAIAGIMGGKDAEVTEVTQSVLLEAAIFNPIIIRRARQRLGLQSESAYRFERGIDSRVVGSSSGQAVHLIQQVSQGSLVLAKSLGSSNRKKRTIDLDVSMVCQVLGAKISPPQIKNILENLGFKLKTKSRNKFKVEVPAHRWLDVHLEIDLIEEIARLFGYVHIPQTVPAVCPQISAEYKRQLIAQIKNILVGLGLSEVITYSLIDRDLLRGLKEEKNNFVGISNPLSKEQAILRPTLIPSLGLCIANNLNQKQEYIGIFEVACVYSLENEKPKEQMVLGLALCGVRHLLLEQGLTKERMGFLHLRGMLEVLFHRLGGKDYDFKSTQLAGEIEIYKGKERVGKIVKLTKSILENLEIKNPDVFVAEIFLDKLVTYLDRQKKFTPLPIYPGISRDISLVLKEGIPIDAVLEEIKKQSGPLLEEVKVIDYYKGKQIPLGFKGLTISCFYRSGDRTLTEPEINPLYLKTTKILVDRFGAALR